tara:strand:+ start:110 stop:304 length:195 start_codon:yes stop_codon:yes gene_type:complete
MMIKMAEKDLTKFLDKIKQLKELETLIKNSSKKKEALTKCSSHEEVIQLTKSWGFDIGKRWGEQ